MFFDIIPIVMHPEEREMCAKLNSGPTVQFIESGALLNLIFFDVVFFIHSSFLYILPTPFLVYCEPDMTLTP